MYSCFFIFQFSYCLFCLVFICYPFKHIGTYVSKQCQSFQIPRLTQNMFIRCFHYLLSCLKYFCNKEGDRWSIFGHIFGSSKNDPKHIAICPEVKVSHLVKNNTPTTQTNTLENTDKKNNASKVCPILGPIESYWVASYCRKSHDNRLPLNNPDVRHWRFGVGTHATPTLPS